MVAGIGSAVVTNWVYYNARESALLAVLYHAAANTMGLYTFPMFSGAHLVMLWWLLAAANAVAATVLVIRTGPSMRHSRQG